ncbi:hypothetical protein LIAUS_16890 [Leptospira interrogans]
MVHSKFLNYYFHASELVRQIFCLCVILDVLM